MRRQSEPSKATSEHLSALVACSNTQTHTHVLLYIHGVQ